MGDSGASRHVCNDMSLLWDVNVREEPILLQLSGEVEVHVIGTIKLDSKNKEGNAEVLHLFDTLYIPQAKVCLFSLQNMRKAHYMIVQHWERLDSKPKGSVCGEYERG